MTDLADALHREMESLREIRDELQLQLKLAQNERRDQFDKLEERWHHAEAKLKQLREVSREELADIGEAARLLVDEIREGYRHLRSLL